MFDDGEDVFAGAIAGAIRRSLLASGCCTKVEQFDDVTEVDVSPELDEGLELSSFTGNFGGFFDFERVTRDDGIEVVSLAGNLGCLGFERVPRDDGGEILEYDLPNILGEILCTVLRLL